MGGRGFTSRRPEKFAKRDAERTARTSAAGGGENFSRSGQSAAALDATNSASLSKTELWWKSLGSEQRNALTKYSGKDYAEINRALRNDKNLVGYYKVITERVNASFNANSSTNKSTIMYRGANVSQFSKTGKALLTKGAEFTDKGFISLSHSRTVANDFLYEKGGSFLIRVKIPKGTRLAYLGNSARSENPSEYEGILKSGTRYKVENVRINRIIKNSFGEKQKVNLVTLRIL